MRKSTKVCINGTGHMTKMAATPIYGRSLLTFLFEKQKSDDLETKQEELMKRALQSVYK